MIDEQAARAAAWHIFDRHFRSDGKLDKVGMLGSALPRDAAVLRSLQALCLEQARQALQAGHHTEGRRLGDLARQLRKLADGPR
ncbi:MAG: hypothetical protein F9K29_05485 [Hyphomicrobiaceae bacterium]|nr:MAG: hypothetical protein F9K29_05485 [Hyphomicrobiaceae bacterium]